MRSVSSGNCLVPIVGSVIGFKKTCTISGLLESTQYVFQIVAFRGTMNVDASFGSLSNIVSTTTPASRVIASEPPATVDTAAPSVALASPLNGASYSRNSPITLTTNATDLVGGTKVDFRVNGKVVCTDSVAPYICGYKASRKSRNVILDAQAYDAAGNVGTSAQVSILVR